MGEKEVAYRNHNERKQKLVQLKDEKQVRSRNDLNILHQNIRSLWGKCGELEILLDTEVTKVDVLCFTEHWLNYHKIKAININHFTLASAFCRENSDHGGSCILVKKGVVTLPHIITYCHTLCNRSLFRDSGTTDK